MPLALRLSAAPGDGADACVSAASPVELPVAVAAAAAAAAAATAATAGATPSTRSIRRSDLRLSIRRTSSIRFTISTVFCASMAMPNSLIIH